MKQALINSCFVALALGSAHASAQNMAYGAPISLELAKKAAKAAGDKMKKGQFEIPIAVVDSGGNLVYLERADQAGLGTIEPAIGKAKAANGIKVPTKVIADMILKQNQSNLIAVPGAMPVEGGVPLVIGNKVVGAIGVSGGMPPDDGAIANAGAKILQP